MIPWQLGPKMRMPYCLGFFQKGFFDVGALGADFRKTPGVDDDVLDALLAAVLHGHGYELGRDDHVGHIHLPGNIQNGRVGLDAADLVGLGVDGVDAPGVAEIQQVLDHPVADVKFLARSADDRHAGD
jgi:hypothetical protein